MTLPGWSAYVIAGVGFGSLLGWWLLTLWQQRVREKGYQAIPGAPEGMRFTGPCTPEKMGRAVGLALGCLQEHTGWSRSQLTNAFQDVLVTVMPAETWTANGQKVGGQEYPANLLVGPSLSALAHEMGHRAQEVIDHIQDDTHATWAGNGIAAADAAYRAEL